MATAADDSKSVVCLCCDRKVVEVDPKTWKLFNEMVPQERYDEYIEPVQMPHVKSTVLKKLLTYSVRISDTTSSSKTWLYDEFLHGEERLTSLIHLIEVADYLDLQSLYADVIQFVVDKSQEEISYMVRNEDLRSLLKIVKSALFYLDEKNEKILSAVLPLLRKSQEEFSLMIVKEDILGLIKLIEMAELLSYEKLRKAAHNLIFSKSTDQLSLEIHNQNLKALIKIFKVARAEKLQTLKDMVVKYVYNKSYEELVQMVSTELPRYQSTYLSESRYLRVGTIELEEIYKSLSNKTLNQKIPTEEKIPIEEAVDGSNQIPIEEAGDGSKKREGWQKKRTKTNELKLVPCTSKKPSTKKQKKDLSDN